MMFTGMDAEFESFKGDLIEFPDDCPEEWGDTIIENESIVTHFSPSNLIRHDSYLNKNLSNFESEMIGAGTIWCSTAGFFFFSHKKWNKGFLPGQRVFIKLRKGVRVHVPGNSFSNKHNFTSMYTHPLQDRAAVDIVITGKYVYKIANLHYKPWQSKSGESLRRFCRQVLDQLEVEYDETGTEQEQPLRNNYFRVKIINPQKPTLILIEQSFGSLGVLRHPQSIFHREHDDIILKISFETLRNIESALLEIIGIRR